MFDRALNSLDKAFDSVNNLEAGRWRFAKCLCTGDLLRHPSLNILLVVPKQNV